MRKKTMTDKIREILVKAKGIYFADYQGIKTSDLNLLRRKLKTSGLQFSVVKNRLAAIVFQELGLLERVRLFLRGPTSLIVSSKDEIAPARILKGFQKTYPIKFKGAILEGTVFTASQFDFLASIPSREELNSKLIQSLLSPINELVVNLEGILNNLIFVFDEMGKKKKTLDNFSKYDNM